jgi:putative membrane protein
MRLTIPTRTANRLRALILILMAIFFAEKLVSGTLYYYIGPRFGWLSIVAVALFIALGGSYNLVGREKDEDDHEHDHEHDEHHDHNHDHEHGQVMVWSLLIVALPLILGVAVPSRPLDASAVSTRGVSTGLASAADVGDTVLSIVPSERNVLDWVRAMSANPAPDALNGQEADVVGFVYRDIRFGEDQFMVARFAITCCVADATAIGVMVQSPEAAQFETNTWVQVVGTFGEGTLEDEATPVLFADAITPVNAPEQPYLFP